MGHMGKKFTLCRICPPNLFQQFHNSMFLFLSCYHNFCDILMVTIQAGARFFECFVLYPAAADMNFTQVRMIPRIYHLGTPCLQYFPNRILHHFHIVRLYIFKPAPITLLWVNFIRRSQKNPHCPISVHPGLAALFQFNRPNTGSGSLQNILQAPPCLQLVFLLLFHYGINIPLGKNRTIFFFCFPCNRKMNLHVFQPINAVFHFVPDIELLFCPELGKNIVFFRHSTKPFLIPWNYILGNITLYSRLVSVL